MKILSSPENKQVNTGEMYFGWVLINNHTPQPLYEIMLSVSTRNLLKRRFPQFTQSIKKKFCVSIKKEVYTVSTTYKKRECLFGIG